VSRPHPSTSQTPIDLAAGVLRGEARCTTGLEQHLPRAALIEVTLTDELAHAEGCTVEVGVPRPCAREEPHPIGLAA
jgi:hypothetical protein